MFRFLLSPDVLLRLLLTAPAAALLFEGSLRAEEKPDPLRIIAIALEADNDEEVAAAERAYASLPLHGPTATLAAYAMANLRIAQKRYDDAQALLDKLSAGAGRSPPVLRMKLWLALQRRDAEHATEYFRTLVSQVAQAETLDAEHLETCGFVAGVSAVSEAAGKESLIPLELTIAANKKIAGLENSAAKSRWEANRPKYERRIDELHTLLREVKGKDPAAATAEADRLRIELERKNSAVVASKADFVKENDVHNEEERENFRERRETSGKIARCKAQWAMPTPGHPGAPPAVPNPPSKPIKSSFRDDPDRKDSKGKIIERGDSAEEKYEDALRDYQRNLRFYEERLAARREYEQVLAVWKQADFDRREKIQAEKKQADEELKDLLAEKEANQEAFDKRRRELRNLTQELQTHSLKLRLTEIVLKANEGSPEKSLFVPANFDLHSPSAERQRILATAKKLSQPEEEERE